MRQFDASEGTLRLRRHCKVRGRKLGLAGELGISPSTLTDILKGRRPTIDQAVRLYEITGIPYRLWTVTA